MAFSPFWSKTKAKQDDRGNKSGVKMMYVMILRLIRINEDKDRWLDKDVNQDMSLLKKVLLL